MAKYRTDVDLWISHENRTVKAGDEFEAVFPKGMKLGDTLHRVKTEKVEEETKEETKEE